MKKMNTNIKKLPVLLILLIVSVVSLFPFYMMVIMGTWYSEDLFKQLRLLPGNYLWNNIRIVLGSDFLTFYWNSFYISTLVTVLCVFVSALAGFAFAKYNFKAKKPLFYFILATMMIPMQLGLVAFVMEMKAFRWTNTHMALIVPSIANAFGVFWMTQFIEGSVPAEVIESARIDGCHEFSIFIRIIIPYIKSAIATLSMLVFLWSWNSYLGPLVLINDPRKFTIPLGISMMDSLFRVDYAARIVGLTMATFPILVIFTVGSKSFIRGLTAGAVKG